MSKTTCPSRYPLDGVQEHRWRRLEGLEGQVEALNLSYDPATAEFTPLSRFLPGADTALSGQRCTTSPRKS
jgi:hypothetical protein